MSGVDIAKAMCLSNATMVLSFPEWVKLHRLRYDVSIGTMLHLALVRLHPITLYMAVLRYAALVLHVIIMFSLTILFRTICLLLMSSGLVQILNMDCAVICNCLSFRYLFKNLNLTLTYFSIIIFFYIIFCHLLHIRSGENREFVFIIIVQFVMSANIRIRFGL